MLEIIDKKFSELTSEQLYNIIALRIEVFIIEQKCLYQDLDYKDQQATHFLCYRDKKLVAYARFLYDEEKNNYSIGRVITASKQRKQGLAKLLLEKILAVSMLEDFNRTIIISSQCYIAKFYESLGFIQTGEPYQEDGLPHIKMIRKP